MLLFRVSTKVGCWIKQLRAERAGETPENVRLAWEWSMEIKKDWE
jgi:hypothetical protein